MMTLIHATTIEMRKRTGIFFEVFTHYSCLDRRRFEPTSKLIYSIFARYVPPHFGILKRIIRVPIAENAQRNYVKYIKFTFKNIFEPHTVCPFFTLLLLSFLPNLLNGGVHNEQRYASLLPDVMADFDRTNDFVRRSRFTVCPTHTVGLQI